jgi:hypothetical protein
LVEQRTLNPLADGSSPSWPTISDSEQLANGWESSREGVATAVCTSVCTSAEERIWGLAIERLTRALATADDDVIPELVAERRALREELLALKEVSAGMLPLDKTKARRGRPR